MFYGWKTEVDTVAVGGSVLPVASDASGAGDTFVTFTCSVTPWRLARLMNGVLASPQGWAFTLLGSSALQNSGLKALPRSF